MLNIHISGSVFPASTILSIIHDLKQAMQQK